MKALVLLIGAMVAAVVPLVTAGPMGFSAWLNVVIVALGAGQVYITKNLPESPIWNLSKTFMAAIAAGLVVFSSALSDGSLSVAEVQQIGVAIVAAIGVWGVRNPDAEVAGKHQL